MLRKILIGFVILMFSVMSTSAYAKVIMVEDLPDTMSEIQDAVNSAVDGDTILIQKGEYAGAWIGRSFEEESGPTKCLKIMGSGPDTRIVEGNWYTDGIDFYGDEVSGSEISNLTIDTSSFTLPEGWVAVGIGAASTNNITIRGIEIVNTNYAAIDLNWADNIQVTNNKIVGFIGGSPLPAGIRVEYSKNSLIAFNEIESRPDDQCSAVGIYMYAARSLYFPTVTGNKIVHNKIAVKTDTDPTAYAVFLYSQRNTLNTSENLIGFNDFRGSEKDVNGEVCYIGYNPVGLADINVVSRNLGDNRHFVPLPEGYEVKDFRPYGRVVEEE